MRSSTRRPPHRLSKCPSVEPDSLVDTGHTESEEDRGHSGGRRAQDKVGVHLLRRTTPQPQEAGMQNVRRRDAAEARPQGQKRTNAQRDCYKEWRHKNRIKLRQGAVADQATAGTQAVGSIPRQARPQDPLSGGPRTHPGEGRMGTQKARGYDNRAHPGRPRRVGQCGNARQRDPTIRGRPQRAACKDGPELRPITAPGAFDGGTQQTGQAPGRASGRLRRPEGKARADGAAAARDEPGLGEPADPTKPWQN